MLFAFSFDLVTNIFNFYIGIFSIIDKTSSTKMFNWSEPGQYPLKSRVQLISRLNAASTYNPNDAKDRKQRSTK